MPIIDNAKLLAAARDARTSQEQQKQKKKDVQDLLDDILPSITLIDIEAEICALIKKGKTPSIDIFHYTVPVLADAADAADAILEDAEQHVSKIFCGPRNGENIYKFITPEALSLLSVILGPHFEVSVAVGKMVHETPQYGVRENRLVATFSEAEVVPMPWVSETWPDADKIHFDKTFGLKWPSASSQQLDCGEILRSSTLAISAATRAAISAATSAAIAKAVAPTTAAERAAASARTAATASERASAAAAAAAIASERASKVVAAAERAAEPLKPFMPTQAEEYAKTLASFKAYGAAAVTAAGKEHWGNYKKMFREKEQWYFRYRLAPWYQDYTREEWDGVLERDGDAAVLNWWAGEARVSEKELRAQAEAMATLAMRAEGYVSE